MPTYDCLEWASMTAVINRIDAPQNFLRNLLYPASTEDTLATHTVELGTLTGKRKMAPFVKRNGRSIMVSANEEKLATVETPNIRISRPMEAATVMYTRQAGTVIFADQSTIEGAFEREVAKDQAVMADRIANAEEWLVAQTLKGKITYSGKEASWELDIPKQQAAITAAATWDVATAAEIEADIDNAKFVMNEYEGLAPDTMILGETAAKKLLSNNNTATGDGLRQSLDRRNWDVGAITRRSQYQAWGGIFLGTLGGLDLWTYTRKIWLPDELGGTEESLIDTHSVHICHTNTTADRVLYFGSIADMQAIRDGVFVGRRFSKSWDEQDPSTLMQLAASNPLPFPKRPDATIELIVSA